MYSVLLLGMVKQNKMKIIRQCRSDDDRICDFICVVIAGLYAVNILPWISSVINIQLDQVSVIIKIAIGVLFLFRMDIVLCRLNIQVIVFFACTIVCSLLGLLLFPENNSYFTSTIITFISSCLPTYIMLSVLRDYDILLNKLYKTSKILGITNLFLFTFTQIVKLNLGVYSMGFGYACLLPSLVLILEIIKKRSLIGIVSLVSFFLSIMTVGSRGPLLAVIFYVIIFFYKYNASNKRYIKLIVFFLLLVVVSWLMNPILNSINGLLTKSGIQSRTLSLLAQGTIHLGNRDIIFQTILDEVVRSPFSIRGINAEYAIVGGYAHNLILELVYQFGIIFGSVIVIWIAIMVMKTLCLKKMNKDSHEQICLIFMCSSIFALMVSGSLWTMMDFWMWISAAITVKKVKKCNYSESVQKEMLR